MENLNITVIFDVVIFVFGVYMFYSGIRMKKTGKISTLLINESEVNRIFDKMGFIDAVYSKMMIFAGIVTFYGMFGFIDDMIMAMPYVNMAGMAIFIIAMVWFFHELRVLKSKFVK